MKLFPVNYCGEGCMDQSRGQLMIIRYHSLSHCCFKYKFNFLDYGHEMHVWNFKTHEYMYPIQLGDNGRMPLEIRFLHDPLKSEGFVGCAFSSTVYRFFKNVVSLSQC